MPQLQVSNKTLKLTNVLIAKMTAEDMQDMAFAEKTENYIKSKGYQPIGPIVQYTGVEQGENGEQEEVNPMLVTRETDYALRVLRGLMDGEQRAVGELSKQQMIPQQFAYKIVKKLSRAGYVQVSRGVDGGCRLIADLTKVSLFDLMAAMEGRCDVNACMDENFVCPWREQNGGCRVHDRLNDIQAKMDETLHQCDLMSLLKEE